MNVCMYVCMYLCMILYVCTFGALHVFNICPFKFVWTRVCFCVCIFVSVCRLLCTCKLYVYMFAFVSALLFAATCGSTLTCVCRGMYAYMHTQEYVSMRTCVRLCVCVCVAEWVYTCFWQGAWLSHLVPVAHSGGASLA